MGGYGTLYYGLKYPGKFTYAYAMSPASWESLKDYVSSATDKSAFPPFTIEVGNQDASGVDNELSKSIADYMKENGLTVEFIARDGQHDWTFWKECLPKALKKIGESFK
jgi:S-formylglutathione hydrolase FrmB